MTVIYDLEHVTTYRYRKPVKFGAHRAIFLPSPGYSGRILRYSLETNIPADVHWMMDTLSNNVAVLQFEGAAKELQVTYRFRGEHFGLQDAEDFPLNERAQKVQIGRAHV